MRMKPCLDCGKQISTSAKRCPACGAKIKRPMGIFKAFFYVIGGLVLIAAMIPETPSVPPPHPVKIAENWKPPSQDIPDSVEEVGSFSFRVAGVTYATPDGLSRQELLKKCSPGQRADLVLDLENRHSNHAVKVIWSDGDKRHHIGYVPEKDSMAAQIAVLLRAGIDYYRVEISECIGGSADKPNRGMVVNMRVFN